MYDYQGTTLSMCQIDTSQDSTYVCQVNIGDSKIVHFINNEIDENTSFTIDNKPYNKQDLCRLLKNNWIPKNDKDYENICGQSMTSVIGDNFQKKKEKNQIDDKPYVEIQTFSKEDLTVCKNISFVLQTDGYFDWKPQMNEIGWKERMIRAYEIFTNNLPEKENQIDYYINSIEDEFRNQIKTNKNKITRKDILDQIKKMNTNDFSDFLYIDEHYNNIDNDVFIKLFFKRLINNYIDKNCLDLICKHIIKSHDSPNCITNLTNLLFYKDKSPVEESSEFMTFQAMNIEDDEKKELFIKQFYSIYSSDDNYTIVYFNMNLY